jgi:hypothetical protein
MSDDAKVDILLRIFGANVLLFKATTSSSGMFSRISKFDKQIFESEIGGFGGISVQHALTQFRIRIRFSDCGNNSLQMTVRP